ncbi:MAG: hypothetical protein RJA59_1617, partial [Pseudomonadota bacterium]
MNERTIGSTPVAPGAAPTPPSGWEAFER